MTLGAHWGFAPASQLEFLLDLEEACWDPSYLNTQSVLIDFFISMYCKKLIYSPITGGGIISLMMLMMLTMSSSVACTHWTKPWSNWSTSWSTSSPRSQTGHGLLLLLHPGHGPLPLHSHLEVVWKGLTPGQHLVGHDLGS